VNVIVIAIGVKTETVLKMDRVHKCALFFMIGQTGTHIEYLVVRK
jgi:hypothetical protein